MIRVSSGFLRLVALMKQFLLIAVLLFIPSVQIQAQLKKLSNTEKVKSFTNGSVGLFKITSEDLEPIYAVKLRNNSQYYEDIVFFLGKKEDMKNNLHDLSKALKNGKRGDTFDFEVLYQKYTLSYSKVLGQACFIVQERNSVSSNFSRLFKTTIDDIIKYIEKE